MASRRRDPALRPSPSRQVSCWAMATAKLGRLSPVEARQVWAHEALDFTPWLLENVDVLSDLLGMDLVLDVAEHPVGGFRLDLKGYDEATGEVVIVENQLGRSDHSHLGQIITYAAGTDPTTIVWVATGFSEEHRAAIDWLNQRTDQRTRLFGVVIRVVQIGDSVPAPNFELVAQPNDWEKEVKRATSTASPAGSPASHRYRQFWENILPQIKAAHPEWTRANTSNQSWFNTSLGLSGVVGALAWSHGRLVSQVYFDSADASLNNARFEKLREQQAVFDQALGRVANWDEMAGRKGARIVLESPYDDVADTTQWSSMATWVIQTQEDFRRALGAVNGIEQLRRLASDMPTRVDHSDLPTDSTAE